MLCLYLRNSNYNIIANDIKVDFPPNIVGSLPYYKHHGMTVVHTIVSDL